MALRDEVALLSYLLNAAGDADAVQLAKAIDPDRFVSYSIRQGVVEAQRMIARGVWPTEELLGKSLAPEQSAALSEALKTSEQLFDASSAWSNIRKDWEAAKQLEILSRGYHDLKDGKCGVDRILRELASSVEESNGWQELDMVDILKMIHDGVPLAPGAQASTLMVTGIESFDKVMSAIPGTYGLIAGMPGTGKTSFQVQCAALSAMHLGTKTFCMSLETDVELIGAKGAATLISQLGGNAYIGSLLKKGGYYPGSSIMDSIKRDTLKFDFHVAGLKWAALEAKIRRMADRGFRLFLVDYFSLLEPPDVGKRDHDAAKYEEMSKSTKILAKELESSIWFVTQPNANNQYGVKPRPDQMSTSKQIWKDCDVGLFLWQDLLKAKEYKEANGGHLKLLKGSLDKNRKVIADNENLDVEPEVWIEAEMRRNIFREIPPPPVCARGIDLENEKHRI